LVIYCKHFGRLFGRLPAMSLKLRSVAVSDRGLIRGANQDSVHAGPWLLAVADGMGGMAAGDLASTITIDAIRPLDVETPEEGLVAALQGAVDTASAGIRAAIAEDPERQGMGTTLTALLLARTGACLALAHVGDSRAYLLRGGTMTQLTRDDTFVQMLVDEGVISPEEAHSHPRRAVVTRALQGEPVTPTYTTVVPQPGGDGCALPMWSARTAWPRRCSATPTRPAAHSGWSTWPCGPAGRTTSPSWSRTSSTLPDHTRAGSSTGTT
jgi:protein phosphatase